VKDCVEKMFPIAVAVGSLLYRSMVARVARVVDKFRARPWSVAKLGVTRYRTGLQRLGGATKAIRVMKESWTPRQGVREAASSASSETSQVRVSSSVFW